MEGVLLGVFHLELLDIVFFLIMIDYVLIGVVGLSVYFSSTA
jgi:hypothetical protein